MIRSPPTAAAVVLAAGSSSRMGEDKLLLELDGESLLRRAVRMAITAGLSPVVVVVGPGGGRIGEVLAGQACSVVVNPDPRRGQGSSLAVGIAALPPGTGGAVVILPDMPRVTDGMIAALMTRWRETGAPLVLSEYAGTLAPPVLYDRSMLRELAELACAAGDQPGKSLASRHRSEAEVVCWPVEALADVDTPLDLAAARAGAASRDKAGRQ